jgi:hypothetical protein
MVEPLLPLIQARLFILEDVEDLKRSLYGEEYDDVYPLDDFEDPGGQVSDFRRRELVVN